MTAKKTPLREAGAAVDRKLAALGIELTVGGEPTFVAADHAHPEWNFEALGPTKRALGRRMAAALRRRLLKKGADCLVTHTMGKQYPGEPLPRWLIGLHWREKGKALLPGADLAAFYRLDAGEPAQKPEAAAKLARALPAALGLKKAAFRPAYEDPSGLLAQEERESGRRHVPVFDPETGRFLPSRPVPAALAARLAAPAGWVLPLDGGKGSWSAPAWDLPGTGRIVLWPGQSPVGLRLPLHLLAPEAPRRALSLEVRDGELSVFFPPVATLDDYLDLLAAVERCAKKLRLGPVVVEGYPPPDDGTLTRLNLLADPGVLEINLPPRADCAGHARLVETLYAAAKESGLRPSRYQYTGRHVGTGGGAHILFGGPSADRSPFFLKPALLPSLIRFFQRHPSLSYLFTGLFTGPSSQAPRIDESAYEVPYEMEIALRGVERMESPVNRHLLDLMLRNLLMDTVGNTHRAEISIDKLWNPYAPNGSLGLVEFRAFEMPPEPEMLAAAVALLRGLAAAFAETPYAEPLVRWGAALHDRFSLPHFLREDFAAVLAYLNERGVPLAPEHFEAWFAFRFPLVGEIEVPGAAVSVSFRQAIEPWPVLGEAPSGGGTSRSVDSSTDRLEISVPDPDGAWGKRWLLLADGVPVPLRPASGGAALGAVRYRMFYRVPGLQPHISAHSPLHFEVVDLRTFRVAAAASLLNWKPGDQPYSGLPQTAAEARARVAERFVARPDAVGELRYLPKREAPVEPLY
ncbi:MAG TPA: transglutaminase family protein, partial [Candidatus Methylacidiphilales bacterium]